MMEIFSIIMLVTGKILLQICCCMPIVATAVFLGIWQFGLDTWLMIIMAALVAFHVLIEIILIIHTNAKVLCKCCYKSKL